MNQSNFDGTGLFRNIFEAMSDIIMIYDVETTKPIYYNTCIINVLGYLPGENTQTGLKFFEEIVHPDDKPVLSHFLNNKDLKDLEFTQLIVRLKRANGLFGWFRMKNKIFSRDEPGNIKEVISITTDITEEFLTQQKLRDEETKFRAIYNNTNDLNFLVDENLQVLAINKTAEKFILNFSGVALAQGDNLFSIVPAELRQGIRFKIKEALEGCSSQLLQSYKYSDGQTYWLRSRYYPVYNLDETGIMGINISLKDVSKVVGTNITLEKQNQQLKEIARMNAHEIRRPLTNILGLIHLVELEHESRSSNNNGSLAWLGHLKSASNELDDVIKKIVWTATTPAN